MAVTRSAERDAYIMAQALYIAAKILDAVEPDYLREVSNIRDMHALLDHHYPSYKAIFEQQDAMKAAVMMEDGEKD